MTKLVCSSCGTVYKTRRWKPEMGEARCGCGGSRVSPSQARRSVGIDGVSGSGSHPLPGPERPIGGRDAGSKAPGPSGRTSQQTGTVVSSAPRRKPLKRGRGLSASPEQQRKVKDLACINCGRDRFEVTITAMHVYPRRFATCSCADGVVPGCVQCHELYEAKKIDLLGLLVAHKFHKELVHAVVVHEAPIFHVLEIVTGTPWVPKLEMAA